MQRQVLGLLLATLVLSGCYDDRRDVSPPAAPRGLYSVTGDGRVSLHWLANTEPDVAGYKIYWSPCARGGGCPYDRVGTAVGTSFVVQDLPNGVTRYYAVSAFDDLGNESDLSYEDVLDTPRPAGTGATLRALQDRPALSGWDFSAHSVRAWDDPRTDVYFSSNGSFDEMLTPDSSLTAIQDMGYATTLDAVDFAPRQGWSPTGTVELIVGHNYVVWTADDHFAKFRVTGLAGQVVFDWAYQIDAGNGELRARPVAPAGAARADPAVAAATRGRFLTPGLARDR